jgi:hypothetical protein
MHATDLAYVPGNDLAQSTSFQTIAANGMIMTKIVLELYKFSILVLVLL